jgi:SpoVK/Ycf46/Vps4 family AAA+-type ATPase
MDLMGLMLKYFAFNKALVTEAALNAVKKSYPQIYHSKIALEIDVSEISVKRENFLEALSSTCYLM